jgi:gliding motility-associated lipoprotein GldH
MKWKRTKNETEVLCFIVLTCKQSTVSKIKAKRLTFAFAKKDTKKRKMNQLKYLVFALMTLLFLACEQRDMYFEDTKTFEAATWAATDTASFVVEITDTTALYDLGLRLSHGTTYPAQNIYLNINTEFPDGQYFSKQVSIDFADKAGKWYGNCSGEWCALEVKIQTAAFFNQIGKYRFTVEQFTRTEQLSPVQSMQFFIENTPKKR